jgi:uncharacterized protein (TIGR03435 family)
MKSLKTTIALIGLALAAGPIAFTQNAASANANAKLPEFEVVSLKPTDPNGRHIIGLQLTKDQLTMDAMTLKGLISVAYNIPNWELSGLDPWMDRDFGDARDHFDLVAKLPQNLAPYNLRHGYFDLADDHVRQMMQAMLADRFHLKIHRETATGKVSLLEQSGKPLLLVPAKRKYASSSDDEHGEIGGAVSGVGIGFYNITMPQLAKFLSEAILHHPVINKTGLDGGYDFRSATIVTDDDIRSGNTMSMFVPMVKEMGLRLTDSTGPVEKFVIDHAEPPSAN